MKLRYGLWAIFLTFSVAAFFLFFNNHQQIIDLALVKEAVIESERPIYNPDLDIEFQQSLTSPPAIIKGIYATAWSAGSAKKLSYFIDLINRTELNSIIIDVKDYTGIVSYHNDIEDVNKYKASEARILKPNALIKKLHDNGIYVIARISVFQDFQLAQMRPDLAVHASSTGEVWQDRKGQTWMEAASEEVWDYNIAIAQDALARGFDEINFDYIRFPSDGDMNDIKYNFWNGQIPRSEIMKRFFAYLRNRLPTAKLSADLFGYTTLLNNDLGIGQLIENALPYFDAIAPMVYPSHYIKGHLGFDNPANHPYEVVKDSMAGAISKIEIYNAIAGTTTPLALAKFRPWLQDFDLGADYNKEEVRAQIAGWYDAATNTPEFTNGWMMWNASNIYTADAFEAENN
ncbi:MAG: putative glycoside hydrolase [bacterium]|nr:putative glycoside hydrolase [bacterium]